MPKDCTKIRSSLSLASRLLPIVFVLSVTLSVFGNDISIEEYRTKLSLTQIDIDKLLMKIAESEQLRSKSVEMARDISRLRQQFQSGQTINFHGGTVVADLDWFNTALDDLESRTDLSERAVLLVGIKERLTAIDRRIEEYQKAQMTKSSKDEDKQKLAEILKREEYREPEPPKESLIQRWLRELREWLNRSFPNTEIAPTDGQELSSLSFFLQVLLFGLLAVVIGFLIFRIVPFIKSRFVNKPSIRKGERVILGERIAADASAFDLFSEAERLAQTGDLRLAIRKGYIALLCDLNDRKLIGLARHKTNRDYLIDVRKRPRLFQNMSGITYVFERYWYGRKNINPDDWKDFRANYHRTLTELEEAKGAS